LHFFAVNLTTSLKIPGAVIPRNVFTQPGSQASEAIGAGGRSMSAVPLIASKFYAPQRIDAVCRFCCKSRKIPGDDFFERNEAKLCSPFNMAPRPLAKSPVSFSLGDEVPHIFVRESHQQPRKILISGGKRLLQQNLPAADSCTAANDVHILVFYSITSSAATSSLSGTVRPSILAVWALMTSSNLLDCTTGRSAGLAPLRMRPA
jgi:hypothetical protein